MSTSTEETDEAPQAEPRNPDHENLPGGIPQPVLSEEERRKHVAHQMRYAEQVRMDKLARRFPKIGRQLEVAAGKGVPKSDYDAAAAEVASLAKQLADSRAEVAAGKARIAELESAPVSTPAAPAAPPAPPAPEPAQHVVIGDPGGSWDATAGAPKNRAKRR